MGETKNYDQDVQKLYLQMLLHDAESFVRVQSIFNPESFDRSLRPVAEFLNSHVTDYKVLPTLEQVRASTGIAFEPIVGLSEGHSAWLLDEFEQFSRYKALEKAIIASADLIEKGQYGEVENKIKAAVQIGLMRDIGTAYFEDPRGRLMMLKNGNGQVSSGWRDIDHALYGGLNRGELTIFAGGSGCVTADTLVEVIELKMDKIVELYNKTQPKLVPISKLKGQTESKLYYVSSPDGWVPVTDCIEKVKNELYTVTLDNGNRVTSSHDHLYQKIDDSWVYARDLVIGDKLLTQTGPSTVVTITNKNKKTKVYDLSVNHHNHRYYTAGISSHNSGKSLLMQNLSLNFVLAGLNGIYFTLELSEQLCSMRLDSMVSEINSRDIFKNIDDVELKVKMVGKKAGALQIKYMNSGSSCNDFRSYIKEYTTRTGVRPDFVCIDYLDLCSPNGKGIDPGNLFVKDKYVSEEMRNLAKDLNLVCITGSQLNRSSVEEVEFDHSHIAGGISKINTADNVIGIFTSRAMRDRGLYQVQFMKTRSSSGVGKKVELDFNVDTLRITDSANSNAQSSGEQLYQRIKTRSETTQPEPQWAKDTGEPAPKATTSSARLRDMLARINTGK